MRILYCRSNQLQFFDGSLGRHPHSAAGNALQSLFPTKQRPTDRPVDSFSRVDAVRHAILAPMHSASGDCARDCEGDDVHDEAFELSSLRRDIHGIVSDMTAANSECKPMQLGKIIIHDREPMDATMSVGPQREATISVSLSNPDVLHTVLVAIGLASSSKHQIVLSLESSTTESFLSICARLSHVLGKLAASLEPFHPPSQPIFALESPFFQEETTQTVFQLLQKVKLISPTFSGPSGHQLLDLPLFLNYLSLLVFHQDGRLPHYFASNRSLSSRWSSCSVLTRSILLSTLHLYRRAHFGFSCMRNHFSDVEQCDEISFIFAAMESRTCSVLSANVLLASFFNGQGSSGLRDYLSFVSDLHDSYLQESNTPLLQPLDTSAKDIRAKFEGMLRVQDSENTKDIVTNFHRAVGELFSGINSSSVSAGLQSYRLRREVVSDASIDWLIPKIISTLSKENHFHSDTLSKRTALLGEAVSDVNALKGSFGEAKERFSNYINALKNGHIERSAKMRDVKKVLEVLKNEVEIKLVSVEKQWARRRQEVLCDRFLDANSDASVNQGVNSLESFSPKDDVLSILKDFSITIETWLTQRVVSVIQLVSDLLSVEMSGFALREGENADHVRGLMKLLDITSITQANTSIPESLLWLDNPTQTGDTVLQLQQRLDTARSLLSYSDAAARNRAPTDLTEAVTPVDVALSSPLGGICGSAAFSQLLQNLEMELENEKEAHRQALQERNNMAMEAASHKLSQPSQSSDDNRQVSLQTCQELLTAERASHNAARESLKTILSDRNRLGEVNTKLTHDIVLIQADLEKKNHELITCNARGEVLQEEINAVRTQHISLVNKIGTIQLDRSDVQHKYEHLQSDCLRLADENMRLSIAVAKLEDDIGQMRLKGLLLEQECSHYKSRHDHNADAHSSLEAFYKEGKRIRSITSSAVGPDPRMSPAALGNISSHTSLADVRVPLHFSSSLVRAHAKSPANLPTNLPPSPMKPDVFMNESLRSSSSSKVQKVHDLLPPHQLSPRSQRRSTHDDVSSISTLSPKNSILLGRPATKSSASQIFPLSAPSDQAGPRPFEPHATVFSRVNYAVFS